MPQLNPEFFLSQLFWFVITFSFLLFFLWKISLPRISSVLRKRESKINEDIQSAKKLQAEAEEIQLEIDKKLHNVYNQTLELIKESTNNLQNKALDQLQTIDNDIKNKTDESAKAIKKNLDDSFKDIKEQIRELTKLTISKLSNIQVTDQEINNVVSKENKLIN